MEFPETNPSRESPRQCGAAGEEELEGAGGGLGAWFVAHSDTREHKKYVQCRSAAQAEKEKSDARQSEKKCDSQFAKIRAAKSDLGMALWHSLEKWMANQGEAICARKPASAISMIKSMDLFQPVKPNQARRLPQRKF